MSDEGKNMNLIESYAAPPERPSSPRIVRDAKRFINVVHFSHGGRIILTEQEMRVAEARLIKMHFYCLTDLRHLNALMYLAKP